MMTIAIFSDVKGEEDEVIPQFSFWSKNTYDTEWTGSYRKEMSSQNI